jgi:Uma2 family endonuclease
MMVSRCRAVKPAGFVLSLSGRDDTMAAERSPFPSEDNAMSIAELNALTLDEFLELPETKPASEFWDGQIRQKPMPMTKHSAIQLRLSVRMDAVSESKKPRAGRVLPELRCTFAGRSVVPDITYVRRERLPLDPDGKLADRFLAAPDIMVEIVSPEQSLYELIEKVGWCVQNGVQVGWLIDPDDQEILEFVPGVPPYRVPKDSVLDGREVLPGFRCPVAEVFSWLREQS